MSSRLSLAIWSPWPPASSGVADYAAEQLPILAEFFAVTLVADAPEQVASELRTRYGVAASATPPDVDLDLYHLGNSPAHVTIYERAVARPGVVLLHDWSLHHLVWAAAVRRGAESEYRQLARGDHGAEGSFVAAQVTRALAGDLLPALYALNDRVLATARGIVGLTRFIVDRVAKRTPTTPRLHLPHHVALPTDLPTRAAARVRLKLPLEATIVTAPGLATAAKELVPAMRAIAAVRRRRPELRLVLAGGVDDRFDVRHWAAETGIADALSVTGRLSFDAFLAHIAAADIVLALRFPSHGEISGALLRSLGIGRPALVTAGTPAAQEFPEGVVVPVDPGSRGPAELEALLDALAGDVDLRERIAALAKRHVQRHHRLMATTRRLVTFLADVAARPRPALSTSRESPLERMLGDELRYASRDLGLAKPPFPASETVASILPPRR